MCVQPRLYAKAVIAIRDMHMMRDHGLDLSLYGPMLYQKSVLMITQQTNYCYYDYLRQREYYTDGKVMSPFAGMFSVKIYIHSAYRYCQTGSGLFIKNLAISILRNHRTFGL